MSFKFGFSAYPDSDDDDNNNDDTAPTRSAAAPENATLPATHHTLASLFPTLPRNISYAFVPLTSTLFLPRRELYDVRMQLMASDTLDSLPGLGEEDIRTRVYEGGLKSWECSLDLAQHLYTAADTPGSVLELGCGTALPTMLVFHRMLVEGKRGRIVLADYNRHVLELVTLPNLFLTWVAATQSGVGMVAGENGDLDASDELREAFLGDLERRGVEVEFVSGGWGKQMVDMVGGGGWDLVLGSETIYSPETTPEFTEVLLGTIADGGRGLVAAKRIYFGVGGSVEDFVGDVERRGGWEVTPVRELADVGVGRVIVEVARKK